MGKHVALFQMAALVTALVGMPAYLLYALLTTRDENRFQWLLRAAYTGAFLVMLFVVAPWEWASYYARWAWLALYAVVLGASYRRMASRPFRVEGGVRTWTDLVSFVLFFGMLAYGVSGFTYSEQPVHLSFPLRDGTYYVGQGGNNPLINYHNVIEAQKYALDILALDAFGRRSAGWYPSELRKYVMYGATVHSPCDGTVVAAADGLPDHRPPDYDRENPPGNHVVISCQGVNVVLAHLQRGSVAADVGTPVATGDPVGAVGNSGNTTEPHLHIHAVRPDAPASVDGQGVPIVFDGRFLVRNSIFVN